MNSSLGSRSLLLLLFILLVATFASADTIYSYTGNHLNSAAPPNQLPCPPACSISGSLTVPSPLAPNLPIGSISPISFSFTDGQVTLDNSNVTFTSNYQIYVGTDGTGNINTWAITLKAAVPAGSVTILQTFNTQTFTPQGSGVIDTAIQYNVGPNFVADITNNPGVWTSNAVPEPSSLMLLGTGLMGIAGAVRKRLRS